MSIEMNMQVGLMGTNRIARCLTKESGRLQFVRIICFPLRCGPPVDPRWGLCPLSSPDGVCVPCRPPMGFVPPVDPRCTRCTEQTQFLAQRTDDSTLQLSTTRKRISHRQHHTRYTHLFGPKPTIEYDFPEPVWPYANIEQLYPVRQSAS